MSRTPQPKIAKMLGAASFLGALLLFSSEPMIGRMLTPRLGGVASVWLTCLMVFQALLFLGYLYAHLLAKRLGRWHLTVLLLPALMLPFALPELPDGDPLWGVVVAMLGSVALPFTALATTTVVTQVWWTRAPELAGREPYTLYAASNLGSFLALFLYPLAIEPWVPLGAQTLVWAIGYAIYWLVMLACWNASARSSAEVTAPVEAQEADEARGEEDARDAQEPPKAQTWRGLGAWLALSALPSGMLVAGTEQLTMGMGSFPMLWTLPLALYLLSFILVFGGRARVLALSRRSWPEAALLCAALLLIGPTRLWLGALLLVAFWMYCMAAHAAMYARRPPSTSLTRFYLATSLGGGLGGALVTLVAPRVFNRHLELPILLLGFVAAMAWWSGRETLRFFREGHILAIAPRLLLLGALAAAAAFMPMVTHDQEPLQTHRNFYGVFEIIDRPVAADDPRTLRKMRHNGTLHGAELRDRRPTEPTTVAYFHPAGAIAAVYAASAGEPRKIAVMGLGTGSVAAFMTPKDTLHFFEIDPDNERLAREWFTFMNTSRARHLEVFVGDGRLLLSDARTGRVPYDLIHMDAFSGDGIPTHLLTIEAMERYLTRLAPDGVLLFHVSNRYYNLLPLLRQLAITYNLHAVTNRRHVQLNPATGKPDPLYQETQCVVMTRDPARLDPLRKDPRWVGLRELPLPTVRLWRDALIDIFSPLRLKMTLDAPEAASPAPPTTTTGAGQ